MDSRSLVEQIPLMERGHSLPEAALFLLPNACVAGPWVSQHSFYSVGKIQILCLYETVTVN